MNALVIGRGVVELDASELKVVYRCAADQHGPVHLPSRWYFLTRCGRKRAHFQRSTLDRHDDVCRECSGLAQHARKGPRGTR